MRRIDLGGRGLSEDIRWRYRGYEVAYSQRALRNLGGPKYEVWAPREFVVSDGSVADRPRRQGTRARGGSIGKAKTLGEAASMIDDDINEDRKLLDL